MAKLLRKTSEDIKNETEETEETVQVTIKTFEGNMNSIGSVSLKCARCEVITDFTKNVPANIMCPKCGSDVFLSLSDFRMEGEEGGIAVSVHDKVTRRGKLWKLI